MSEVLLAPTPEQRLLRTSVRSFLVGGPAAGSEWDEDTDDSDRRSRWLNAGAVLGLPSLLIPEDFGGAGLGLVDLVFVCEELGGALYGGPMLSSAVLATAAVCASDDPIAKAKYLPALAAGEIIAAVSLSESTAGWPRQPRSTRAEVTGDVAWVTGTKRYVLDGRLADIVFLTAIVNGGSAFVVVDTRQEGVQVEGLESLDATRRFAHIRLERVRGTVVGALAAGDAIIEAAASVAGIALAAEQVGGAQRVLDLSVQYATNRYQFGRAIGSFQAIKHKCVNVLLQIESARSLVYHAAAAFYDDSDARDVLVSAALAASSEAYLLAAAENIQIHGGLGMTWEHSAHRYFRRATVCASMLGDGNFHRRRIADWLFAHVAADYQTAEE